MRSHRMITSPHSSVHAIFIHQLTLFVSNHGRRLCPKVAKIEPRKISPRGPAAKRLKARDHGRPDCSEPSEIKCPGHRSSGKVEGIGSWILASIPSVPVPTPSHRPHLNLLYPTPHRLLLLLISCASVTATLSPSQSIHSRTAPLRLISLDDACIRCIAAVIAEKSKFTTSERSVPTAHIL